MLQITAPSAGRRAFKPVEVQVSELLQRDLIIEMELCSFNAVQFTCSKTHPRQDIPVRFKAEK